MARRLQLVFGKERVDTSRNVVSATDAQKVVGQFSDGQRAYVRRQSEASPTKMLD